MDLDRAAVGRRAREDPLRQAAVARDDVADVTSRLNALDSGGNPTYTLEQMLSFGDA
jgi:hypothetical protein